MVNMKTPLMSSCAGLRATYGTACVVSNGAGHGPESHKVRSVQVRTASSGQNMCSSVAQKKWCEKTTQCDDHMTVQIHIPRLNHNRAKSVSVYRTSGHLPREKGCLTIRVSHFPNSSNNPLLPLVRPTTGSGSFDPHNPTVSLRPSPPLAIESSLANPGTESRSGGSRAEASKHFGPEFL